MSARLWHTITIVGWTAIAHCAPRLINDLSQWSSEVIPIQQVVGPRSILYASLVVHTALKGQVDPLFFVGAHPCGTSHVPPFGVCRSATPYVQGWDVLTLVRTWDLHQPPAWWFTAALSIPERRCPGLGSILGPCGHGAEALLNEPPSHVWKCLLETSLQSTG